MLEPALAKMAFKLLLTLAALYGASALVLFALMHGSNAVAGKTLSLVPGPAFALLPMESMWCRARQGALEVGQEAPEFDLWTLDKGSRVRLSALRGGKPVVLVFGSYTCPPFRREMPAVNQVFEDYADRASFYFIYLDEAHAHDVWPLAANAKANIVYSTARDSEERAGVAQACSKALKVKFPVLVDDLDDRTGRAYTAWPTRLYVIDPAGRIAYKSRPGPFGFEAAELEKALARVASPTVPAT